MEIIRSILKKETSINAAGREAGVNAKMIRPWLARYEAEGVEGLARFAHKGSLVAYAGVVPGANQSGTHEAKSTASSKSNSPELRKMLFLVMSVQFQTMPANDPVFQFLDKKRAEGKPCYVYMIAGANKFFRVYYGRVKEFLTSLNSVAQSLLVLTFRPALSWRLFVLLFSSSVCLQSFLKLYLIFYL